MKENYPLRVVNKCLFQFFFARHWHNCVQDVVTLQQILKMEEKENWTVNFPI